MPPIEIPEQVKERMALDKLCAQYKSVFGHIPKPGHPDTRTEAQLAVWKDLEIAGYKNKPSFVQLAGQLCPLRAAMADGRRSLFLEIEANVTFTPKLAEQPKQ